MVDFLTSLKDSEDEQETEIEREIRTRQDEIEREIRDHQTEIKREQEQRKRELAQEAEKRIAELGNEAEHQWQERQRELQTGEQQGSELRFSDDDHEVNATAGTRRIVGGGGRDLVNLDGSGATLTVSNVETLIGGSGSDDVELDSDGRLTMSAIERLRGMAGRQWVELASGGNTFIASGIETLVGGSGYDDVWLSDADRLILAAFEQVRGSSGQQWVDLGNRGNTTHVSGVETLIGGTGDDDIWLDGSGDRLILTAIEHLHGASGGQWVDLGNRGNTLHLTGVETLVGGSGSDTVWLDDDGGRLILAAIESVHGGTGGQWVDLGNRGCSLTLDGVETLLGGAGGDYVQLSDGGNTIILVAVETLIGGAGEDRVQLGNRGNSMTVKNVETIIGGGRADDIRIGEGSGAVQFEGRGGGDVLRLLERTNVDRVVLSDPGDGAQEGAHTGYDDVRYFEGGNDQLLIAGALRALVDRNADQTLSVTVRGGGTANLDTDEAIFLSTRVGDLADGSLASFRAALGTVSSSTDQQSLVIASDGSNTGLYAVRHAGAGSVLASEARLVSVFRDTVLATGDIAFG